MEDDRGGCKRHCHLQRDAGDWSYFAETEIRRQSVNGLCFLFALDSSQLSLLVMIGQNTGKEFQRYRSPLFILFSSLG